MAASSDSESSALWLSIVASSAITARSRSLSPSSFDLQTFPVVSWGRGSVLQSQVPFHLHACLISNPDPSRQVVVEADAFDPGVGMFRSQWDLPEQKLHLCAFLQPLELRNCTLFLHRMDWPPDHIGYEPAPVLPPSCMWGAASWQVEEKVLDAQWTEPTLEVVPTISLSYKEMFGTESVLPHLTIGPFKAGNLDRRPAGASLQVSPTSSRTFWRFCNFNNKRSQTG